MALVALCGCIELRGYACVDDTQCSLDGLRGKCQPNGYCSYADDNCGSGQRFEALAPAVGGDCVVVEDAGTQPATGSSSTAVTSSTTPTSLTVASGGSSSESSSSGLATSSTGEPFQCAVPGCEWVTLDAGEYHVCAVNARAEVWCWGANLGGQLGMGMSPDFIAMPRKVEIGMADSVILATNNHSCAVVDDIVKCWGPNDQRQADFRDTAAVLYGPKTIDINGVVPTAISTGSGRTCASQATQLACWGQGIEGDPPLSQNSLSGVLVELAVGGGHQCARLDDGTVYCLGQDVVGQLGDGEMVDSTGTTPVEATFEGERALSIDSGSNHTCAITEGRGDRERNIWCWGANEKRQAGSLGGGSVYQPALIAGELVAGDWVEVDAADEHTCALSGDGEVWCWGTNLYGRADPRAGVEWTTASRKIELENVDLVATDIATGNAQTCALGEDGVIWCWGCLTPWALLGSREAECPEDDGAEAAYPPM